MVLDDLRRVYLQWLCRTFFLRRPSILRGLVSNGSIATTVYMYQVFLTKIFIPKQ